MKKLRIIALALVFMLMFAGCSSKAAMDSFTESFDGGYRNEMDYIVEEPMEEAVTEEEVFDSISDSSSSSAADPTYAGARKLIRTFDLTVETLEFDDFIAAVKKEVSKLGGYIESSSVSGNSYNYTSNRNADFVCRIPSDKLNEFVNTVGGLGNVTYSYEDARDITLTYVDTEARIKSLQTEYDRLLELLAEAENIDTIILLEQRITEVRYQLESYQSQLRTYDNLVDYSTVNLYVNEVKRITAPEQETVWQRIQSDFSDNIYDIWVGAENFFVWFVANIPYFIIWGVIIAVIVIIVRLCFRNNTRWQERKAARKAKREYKKAMKAAKKNENAETAENTEEK